MRLMIIAAALAATLFATPAGAAVPMTGNSYLDFCGRKDRTICKSYTVGVADGIIATRFLDPAAAQIWIPDRATTPQLISVATDFIRSMPKYRHYDALQFLAVAYKEAFPCEGFK